MKHTLLKLNVRQGSIETVDHSVHEHNGEFNPYEYAKEYIDGGEGSDGSYEFMDGNVIVEINAIVDLTEKEYEVLRKFIP